MEYIDLAKQYFKTDDIKEVSGSWSIANDHMDDSPWSADEIEQSEVFKIVIKEYSMEYFCEFGNNMVPEGSYLTNLYELKTKYGLIAYCDSQYPFFFIKTEDYNELVQCTYTKEYRLIQEILGTRDIITLAGEYCLQEGHDIGEELTDEEKIELQYYKLITKNIDTKNLIFVINECSGLYKIETEYGLIVMFIDGLSWLYISKENFNKLK